MKINKILLLLFALSFAAGCSAQKKSAKSSLNKTATSIDNQSVKPENVVKLKEGENKFLKNHKINLTLKRITEDSRCPKGVQCIAAGSATAEIEVMTLSSRPRKILLSIGDLRGNLQNSIIIYNHKITLLNILPEKTQSADYDSLKGKYSVELKVESAAAKAKSSVTR